VSDASSDSALVTKVHVVDGASLRFTETGHMATDSWEIEWEATPAPAERAQLDRQAAQPSAPAAPPEPQPAPRAEPEPQPAPRAAPQPASAPQPEPVQPEPEPQPVIEAAPPPPSAPSSRSAAAPSAPPRPDAPPPASAMRPAPPPPSAPRHAPQPDYLQPAAHEAPAAHRPPPPRHRPHLGGDGMETMPVVFRGLQPASLHRAIHHFDVIDLYAHETLIAAGERHPSLVMVLRGQLEARRGNQRRRAGSGEVLGLTTLFGSGRWPTTLRTLSECRLMVLELAGYQALRTEGSRVGLAIEEYALEVLLDALVNAWKEVAQFLTPQPLSEVIPPKSFFARCAAAFGAGGVLSVNVNRTDSLAASPMFRNAEHDHLVELSKRFDGLKVDPGEFLLRQGEASTRMYLVVDGAVDVLSATRGGNERVVCHETLGPGSLFGESSMLRTAPSPASYMARERTVLLELDRVAWAELALLRSPVGSVLRLAVLRSLTRQLVQTQARRLELSSGGELQAADLHDRFITILPGGRR